MESATFLIVNADDFGASPSINRGVLRAHSEGIVTSASLMVRWPASEAAALAARDHSRLSLGLHFDFGEWICSGGTWEPMYKVVDLRDYTDVAAEAARQLDAFRQLVGRDPTHLDSHQHVHRSEPALSVLTAVAVQLGVPLRQVTPRIRYCGDFYGQDGNGNSYAEIVTVEGLTTILKMLPPGWTELGCHPGDGHGDDLKTMYRQERAWETNVLCDPIVRATLAELEIELRSFAGLGGQKNWSVNE